MKVIKGNMDVLKTQSVVNLSKTVEKREKVQALKKDEQADFTVAVPVDGVSSEQGGATNSQYTQKTKASQAMKGRRSTKSRTVKYLKVDKKKKKSK